jgi:aminoglycoside 3-N-acetyltransferase
MKTQLYNVMRSALSQEDRNRIKRRIAHTRKQLAPVYRLRHGLFTASELASELTRHVPADAEILMVHCSVNDLEPMYTGNVTELLDALTELCGPERTLAMPAFFFGGAEGSAEAYYRAAPHFDARRQPSQMGLLSELFRRRAGVRRSLHPTHSVCAAGPLADELLAGHHTAGTTFGAGTPFAVMAEHRTAIVGIGTQYFRCLTQVHAAEDLLGERYPLSLRDGVLPVQLKERDGTIHAYDLPLNRPGHARRLEYLERILGPAELTRWRFHGVPLFVTSASAVTDALRDAALRGETIYESMPIRSGAATRRRAAFASVSA